MSREFAKLLRRNLTPVEWRFWHSVKSRQLAGAKFRRQVPVGPYVADFLCISARLIVELDGGQHSETVSADAARTRYLEEQGYRVLRFWNNDVMTNLEGVLRIVELALAGAPLTLPSPPATRVERKD
ncbi:endonuclease domain-containing protein [Hypericibacter sp.]|uniref:endonuclease domain-containing protein n=1 Tax=Hypericibacter sp. TaxID=2705401 RepID=UPI003D6CE9A9